MYEIITKTENCTDTVSAKKTAATAILKELLKLKMEQKADARDDGKNSCKEIA